MSDVQTCAAVYIRRGFRPIPLYGVSDDGCGCGWNDCKQRDWGKHEHPDTDGKWKDGYLFTADDFGADDNIALAMGPQPDGRGAWLVCLDADAPDSDTGFDFEHHLGPLPPTMTAKSPRGEHRFFSVEPFTPLGNWVDCFRTKDSTGTALDLRYARGRVVVAPSRNAFGRYLWTDGRSPAALPVAALDAILDERRRRGLPVLDRWERGEKRA